MVATISCCPHLGRAARSEPPPCCDRLMGHSDVGRSPGTVWGHAGILLPPRWRPGLRKAQAYQVPWENPTFVASPSRTAVPCHELS